MGRQLRIALSFVLSSIIVLTALTALPVAVPIAASQPSFVTTITVTTTADLDIDSSKTCAGFPAEPCSLRRAIVQARNPTAAPRPVLINFNLPANQANAGDAAGTWTLMLSEGANLRDLAGGQVTIDGSTQPGGRSSGPKVFIHGSTQADRLVINGNENRLIGLGFQYYDVLFNGSNNLVQDVWSGLEASGQAIYFLRGNPEVDSRASFGDATASTGNVYRNVVITGSRTMAITMRGKNGTIENSLFGTRADGTVPAVAVDRKCRPNARYNNWFGGAGITLMGTGHTVRNNRFVGLLWASKDPLNTPPVAIDINTANNRVENNIIGIDSAGQKFGICSDAIRLTSSGNQLLNNTIYGAGVRNDDPNKTTSGEQPQTGAIGISGSGVSLGANLMRGNLSEDSIAPVFFFPSVSVKYSYFNPAKVTAINGRTVSGSSGDRAVPPAPHQPFDCDCPNCVIELFLDDRNGNRETLTSLGTVTADAQGNWTATNILPEGGLGANQGLRTQITTAANGTIQGFNAGTSSRVSRQLYGPEGVIDTPPPPARARATAPTVYSVVQPRPVPATPTYSFKTTITVNSTLDPDTNQGTTCATNPCTLRRAIVQARALEPDQRPVLIQFNIPTDDPGYNAAPGVWRIDLNSATSNPFRRLEGGQIVIDGTTQPGGRAEGPKIFVRGSNTQHILIVDSRDNIIRGLGLQGFGIQVNFGGNFIEQNWLGLNEDGQSIYYISGDSSRDNKATIQDAETPPAQQGGNVYRNNVVTGSRVSALTVRSDDSWVVGNYVGTRADGTIPTTSANVCTSLDWISGDGISLLGGKGTQVGGPSVAERNYLVGLSIRSNDPNVTQPIAIQVGSVGNYLIQNNYIGRDTAERNVGICGEGIRMSGDFTVVRDNYIVASQNAMLNHLPNVVGANANTYQGNRIVESQQAIIFGPIVPEDLAFFNPAKLTALNGTLVRGTSGDPGQPPGGKPPVDSSCPFCTVEILLDNRDNRVEALQSLGTVQADANGNWAFSLPRALTNQEGLRTLSTTNNYGVINQYEAGTSTKVSELYTFENVLPPAINIADGATLTNPRPTFSGTGLAGDRVRIFRRTVSGAVSGLASADGDLICTTTVGTGGSWSCTPEEPLPSGALGLRITVSDTSDRLVYTSDLNITVQGASEDKIKVFLPLVKR
jgi:CSLREA domain-containing protein